MVKGRGRSPTWRDGSGGVQRTRKYMTCGLYGVRRRPQLLDKWWRLQAHNGGPVY